MPGGLNTVLDTDALQVIATDVRVNGAQSAWGSGNLEKSNQMESCKDNADNLSNHRLSKQSEPGDLNLESHASCGEKRNRIMDSSSRNDEKRLRDYRFSAKGFSMRNELHEAPQQSGGAQGSDQDTMAPTANMPSIGSSMLHRAMLNSVPSGRPTVALYIPKYVAK